MRLRTLLATTAIIAAVTTSAASAQTTAPSTTRTKKDATATTRTRSKSTYLRRHATRSTLPPAPSIPTARSHRRSTTSRKAAGPGIVGMDDTGRHDLAGKPVPFYSSIRGKTPVGVRQSAAKRNESGGGKPHENAQKDPFKKPGRQ